MKKKILIITGIIIAIIIAAVALTNTSTNTDTRQVVKIGFNIPLTGEVGIFGEIMKCAATLAKQDLAERDTKYRYEFVFENNAFDLRRMHTAHQKLATRNRVDAVIDTSSKSGMVIGPLAVRDNIIHFNVSAIDDNVATHENTFVHWTRPSREAELFVKQFKGTENLAILTTIDQDTQALADAVKKAWRGTYTEYLVNPDEKQMGPIIDAAMNKVVTPATRAPTQSKIATGGMAGADVYLLLLYSPSIDIAIRRLQERRTTATITSLEYFNFLENPALANGYWFIDAADANQDFRERFIKQCGIDMTFTAGNTYDAIMILVNAFESAPNRADAINVMRAMKTWNGVVGHLTMDKNGIFNSTPTIKKIINGVPVEIKQKESK